MIKKTNELQAELDAIIAWFEQDDMDIDLAAEKYKQGLALAAEIQKRLNETKNTITKLKNKFDA
jgi:exodeoxyribonuclease VII small subunit